MKMTLAVLRQKGAGCSASVTTVPLSDIIANRIVHPSMFTFLAVFPFLCFVGRFLRHGEKHSEEVFDLLTGNRSAKPQESRCPEARETSSRILVRKYVRGHAFASRKVPSEQRGSTR